MNANFALTCLYFVSCNVVWVRREAAPHSGGESPSSSVAAERVQAAGSVVGGFCGKRSEPSVWRPANPTLYYLKWKSRVHWRDGTDILQNRRGQEVVDEMEGKWSERVIDVLSTSTCIFKTVLRETRMNIANESSSTCIAFPACCCITNIQGYVQHDGKVLFLIWTLVRQGVGVDYERWATLVLSYARSYVRSLSYSADLKIRMLPDRRRKRSFWHEVLSCSPMRRQYLIAIHTIHYIILVPSELNLIGSLYLLQYITGLGRK